MHLSLAQTILDYVDDILSIAMCAMFFQPRLRKLHRSLFAFLCVRAATIVALEFIMHGPLIASPMAYTKAYFLIWWGSFTVSSILLLLVCMNTYRQALAHLPGLARVGNMVFLWTLVATTLVTASSFTSYRGVGYLMMDIMTILPRLTGTVELCLLAFLALCMNALDLGVRSRPFGIALGLGIFATNDWVQSYAISMKVPINGAMQLVFECLAIAALGTWVTYFLLPEPARKPLTLPVNSTIYRWNQIASALGHKGTQVAMQPQPSFFLADVEKVVERAFARTAAKESEGS